MKVAYLDLCGIQNAFFPRNAILPTLLHSDFISSTILSIRIQISSRIPLGCKNFAFLHDNLLRFPDYQRRANIVKLANGIADTSLISDLSKYSNDNDISCFRSNVTDDFQAKMMAELSLLEADIAKMKESEIKSEVDFYVQCGNKSKLKKYMHILTYIQCNKAEVKFHSSLHMYSPGNKSEVV